MILPRSMYEPEQYPGLIHIWTQRRFHTVFSSGKLVCTGAKMKQTVQVCKLPSCNARRKVPHDLHLNSFNQMPSGSALDPLECQFFPTHPSGFSLLLRASRMFLCFFDIFSIIFPVSSVEESSIAIISKFL